MRTIGHFTETSKKVEITMTGWDGTGYNGEGKKMNVWTSEDQPGHIYVCRWMACYKEFCFLEVDFDNLHKVTKLPQVFYTCSFGPEYLVKK